MLADRGLADSREFSDVWAAGADNADDERRLNIHIKYADRSQEAIDLADPEDVARLSLVTDA